MSMDRQNGQHRPVQGWNHAGTGAQTPPDAGRLKPLAPIRPLATYPPNEPYGRRTPAPARPIPMQASAAPAPAAWPDPYAAQAAPYYPAPQSAQGGAQPYGTPRQPINGQQPTPHGQAPYLPAEATPAQQPAEPWQTPDARPVWLPPSVSPISEPARRTLLQAVPQTAPLPRPTAPPPDAPLQEAAQDLRRRRATPADEPTSQPDLPAEPPEATAWPMWQPEAAQEGFVPGEDANDEDSGRFDAVPQQALPEPLPVPTYGYMPPRRGGGRRAVRVLLLTLAVLAAAVAALYFTGLLDGFVAMLRPANGSVPTVFGQSQAAGSVAPAAQAATPALRSIAVAPASAVAPATLVFTLTTNTATSAIRLLMADGTALRTTANATPQGDGLLWQANAYVDAPRTGTVRVYLRDEAGAWSTAALTCDIAVG